MELAPYFTDELAPSGHRVNIAHWTPGRVRVAFEDINAAERFAKAVIERPGVTSARVNDLTGSVLVHYSREIEGALPPGTAELARATQSCCAHCQRPVEAADDSRAVRRLLMLLGAILTGDVLGIVSWVFFSAAESNDERRALTQAA